MLQPAWRSSRLTRSVRPCGNLKCAARWLFAVAVLANHSAGARDELEGPAETPSHAAIHDVYINDSLEANDAITQARQLSRAKRWTEAAELLQRASDTAGDKLIRRSHDHYVGIREHVNAVLADWPEEGIAAYRELYEREIVAALEATSAARSLDEYLPLFDRYFCTSTAAELADGIGQLAIEAGDLALAQRVYTRVLDHHPDAADFASRYSAMLALLSVMRGARPESLAETEAPRVVRWMGKDRTVGEIARELGTSFTALRAKPSPSDWPIFAGNAERNRAARTRVDELGLRWRFRGFGALTSETDVDQGLDKPVRRQRESVRRLTMFPVVAGDLIYVQHHREIVALHRITGVIAWRYRPEGVSPSDDFADWDEPPSGWDSVTVHDGRVYAALPGDVVPDYGYETVSTPPELVCLDAETGRLLWPQNNERIPERFAEISLDSSPLVRQGRVYLVGRRRRSFGFEDCYLLCFDGTDGTLKFRTHLGSASTGTFGSPASTTAIAALHDDTVLVCTNLGTIAAVSAYTGEVRWLRLYERALPEDAGDLSWGGRPLNPPALNPVICSDGRVFCLPPDGAALMILDEEDGRLRQSIPTEEFAGVEMLLGVRGNVACGLGYEAACYDLAVGSLQWSSPLPTKAFGRGVWADDHLLIPTREGLSVFRVADGEQTQSSWDANGTGGNLLVVPDQLVVSGDGVVSAYVRKAELWNALRERMAAVPTDPLPALELAEVALQSGEPLEAVEALDEAVRRVGGFVDPLEPKLRRRFFDDVMRFAGILASRSVLSPELLEKLFGYASRCPPDTSAHLAYRFRFAAIFEKRGQPERALHLYQQILRDRSLREHRAAEPTPTAESGGARAKAEIDRLRARHGSEVYAPYETEARQWFDTAWAKKDPTALARVVDTFPNSGVAADALVKLGELMVEAGRPDEAATYFIRAYQGRYEQVDQPALMRKVADAYEQVGRTRMAYRWLTKIVREHPEARIEHDGRMVTTLDYRERLAHVRDRVEPSRPQIDLPLTRRFAHDFTEPVLLLTPRFDDDPETDWSRYFVYTAAGIRAFAARGDRELWSQPAPVPVPPDLLIATSRIAVFANKHEVFGVDAQKGIRQWTSGRYPEDFEEVAADWEDGKGFRTHLLKDGKLISVREDGLVTCRAIEDGRLLWSQTHRPVPAGHVHVGARWIAFPVVQEEGSSVSLIDGATGRWGKEIAIGLQRPIERLHTTLEGQLIVVTSRSISSYDVHTATQQWHVPVEGHVRSASVLWGLDAAFLSDDGRTLQKLSLADGGALWQSGDLVRRGEEDLSARQQNGSLIVSTSSSLCAVDEVSGLTLWRATEPRLPRFLRRAITQSHVVAIDVPDEPGEPQAVAYFYDHRNASGIIPADGGNHVLGPLENIRAVLVIDGTILVQTGATIRGWTE